MLASIKADDVIRYIYQLLTIEEDEGLLFD